MSEYLDCEQSLFCSKICKRKYLSSEVARVTRARVAKVRIRAKRESAMVPYIQHFGRPVYETIAVSLFACICVFATVRWESGTLSLYQIPELVQLNFAALSYIVAFRLSCVDLNSLI